MVITLPNSSEAGRLMRSTHRNGMLVWPPKPEQSSQFKAAVMRHSNTQELIPINRRAFVAFLSL